MPWEIENRGGSKPYCVIKKTDGENEGCHATRTEAEDHMAALYASEPKEADMDKAEWSTSTKNNLPDSAFLYIEPGGKKDAEGKTTPRSLRHLPYKNAEGTVDLPHLRNAISRLSQSNTGSGGWLSESLRKRLLAKARRILSSQQKSVLDHLSDGLKWLFGLEDEKEVADVNRFMVWKDGAHWRWLAIYSNKFRDDDVPPEILTEQAHKDFVAAVDAGEWDYPELWLWHQVGTKSGYADFVAYDDRGFSISSGVVTNERVAKALAEDDDLLVSHGMPKAEIRREDPDDPTILTRYRTKEISPLPSGAAANKLTGFVTMGGTMAIPKEKREFLLEKLGDEDFAALEESLADKAKQAEAEGLEFKDDSPKEEVAEEQAKEAEETAEVKDEPGEEVAAEEPVYVTQEDLVEEVGGMFHEFADRLQNIEARLDEFGKSLKQLERSEEERIAEKAAETPAASLGDMLRQRAVGAAEAQVDGRTQLGKAGPKERDSAANGPTPVPLLNNLMAASRAGIKQ